MKHLLYIVCYLAPLWAGGQQVVTVKVVSSENQQPIEGATLKVIPGNRVVRADHSAVFRFTVQPNDVAAEISHMGYSRKVIPISELATIKTIQLEPNANELTEVKIYSGYQSLPRERATGSFSVLDQKTFNQQVGTNVIDRLPAMANGLMADNSASNGRLMVRGLSTIQGDKQPLIILDNFPYEGDINNINPNEVETVTILKDAAAASIWGSRAGNGVIVISTKKGGYNKGIAVNLVSNLTIGEKENLSYIKQMASADYIGVEEYLYQKGFYASAINSTNRTALSPIVELLLQQESGAISKETYAAERAALAQVDVRDQFRKYLYSHSVNQQYALNINGGTERHSWLASTGYDHNKGTLGQGERRYNLRFQNAFKPVKNLQLTSEMYYTQYQTRGGRPGYGSITVGAANLYPYARFADENGKSLTIAQKRQGYIDTAGGGRLLDWNYYPLEDHRDNTRTHERTDLIINTGINYTLLKGLAVDMKYQYQQQQGSVVYLMNRESYFSRNLVNTYTQLGAAGSSPVYIVPPGGVVDRYYNRLRSNNFRAQLNYNGTWNRHELNVIGGLEIRQVRSQDHMARTFGYNEDLLTFGNVDLTRQYPEYITKALSYIPGNSDENQLSNRFVSTYFNASYSFDQRYTISASARRDASNLFGLNTKDKWKPLWSVGGSWDISRERFYRSTWMSYLRLRATYGFSGNVDPSKAAVTTIRYMANNLYMPVPYAIFSNYANPELTWETSRMLNVGLDFRAFSNRLNGSVEYYLKKGSNLFGQSLIDYTSGIGTSIVKNTASMKSKGLDIELNSQNVIHASFKWTSNLNLSYNRDRITDYYLNTLNGSSFVTGNPISGVVGKPVYSLFSYRWAGLNPQNGNPMGYFKGQQSENYIDLTGTRTQLGDLAYEGPRLPVWFGSLGNTFSYKGWSATFRLVYKLGHYFRRGTISYNDLLKSGKGHSDFGRRWQVPGDEASTSVPSFVYPANQTRDAFYAGSEALVEHADHVRLQYVTLSYSFSEKRLKRIGINHLSVFLNANNLGIIWRANQQGIDPETIYSGYFALSPTKNCAIGLRAAF